MATQLSVVISNATFIAERSTFTEKDEVLQELQAAKTQLLQLFDELKKLPEEKAGIEPAQGSSP
jgi:hypothetical protein